MFREFKLTNFKPFAGPATIPIRPLTLIFGPNSSGKSSIFQCLLMLKQTIESADAKTNLLIKGDLVDLGSYREFIYRHETERSFSFRAMILSRSAYPYIDDMEALKYDDFEGNYDQYVDELLSMYKTLGLSITFAYNDSIKNTIISCCKLEYELSPLLGDDLTQSIRNAEIKEEKQCIKKFDHFLPFHTNDDLWLEYKNNKTETDDEFLSRCAALGIERALKSILHIGPMREYPERFFSFSGNQTNYVGKSGKYVPDVLITDKELLAKVNNWFDRLEMGYELKIGSLNDFSTDLQGLFALRLCSKSSGVHVGITDVGFGISQVLPVIVQSVLSESNTILIEQPEYHLHPRLQAEMGDLFIESALGRKNTFLIETHSEHLILRILKRIRQTAEGELPDGLPRITPSDVSVMYIYPMKDGSGSKVVQIPVTEDGDFAVLWPDGFFSERAKELM
jgi:predicted ATPase